MPRFSLLAALSLIVCSGCGDAEVAQTVPARKTEVVVIGTQPFITDMPSGYTPGHLRALLEKVKPDLIAVEAATNVKSPLSTAPYDCRHVTIPWARENDIPIVAVGIMENDYGRQVSDMQHGLRAEGRDAALKIIDDQLQRQLTQIGGSMTAINSADWQQSWRRYHQQLHRLVGADTPWETWNSRVFRKIQRLCEDNPGKRIAVVFGAAHTYYFQDQLAGSDGIEVRPVAEMLPLTETAVDRHTAQVDYLKALRPLNMVTVSPEALVHCERVMRHLEQVPGLQQDYTLFSGKLQMHSGDHLSAVATFDRLAESAGDTISQFDGHNRIADGARLGAIMALAKAGRNADAVSRLKTVLSDNSLQQDVRQFAQQMLRQLGGMSVTAVDSSR